MISEGNTCHLRGEEAKVAQSTVERSKLQIGRGVQVCRFSVHPVWPRHPGRYTRSVARANSTRAKTATRELAMFKCFGDVKKGKKILS